MAGNGGAHLSSHTEEAVVALIVNLNRINTTVTLAKVLNIHTRLQVRRFLGTKLSNLQSPLGYYRADELEMLQAKNPATPISQTPQIKPNAIPGSWRHPHLDEVTRRLNKSTFSEKNFRTIMISAIFLIASFSYPGFIGN